MHFLEKLVMFLSMPLFLLTGLLLDLRCKWRESVFRKWCAAKVRKFRRECACLLKNNCGAYLVEVGTSSFSELLLLGNYGGYNDWQHYFTEDKPHKATLFLWPCPEYTTWETAPKWLAWEGLRPASVSELLVLGAILPKDQSDLFILAIDDAARQKGVYLWQREGERSLGEFHAFEYYFPRTLLIAAVRLSADKVGK